MDRDKALQLAERFLGAWNVQDVDAVLDCYTEDVAYLDPNTKGHVEGHDAMRRYLARLFQGWNMHWSLREFFLFEGGDGGAFLWRAKLTPAAGGDTKEVDGMDLVVLRGDRMCRNEVYFDRAVLFG